MSEKRTLQQAMAALLASGAGADVTLSAGGRTLKAHGLILSARSPVFAAMLQAYTREAATGHVSVPDVEGAVMQQLLTYIYTDEVPVWDAVSAAKLLVAADKYDLPRLKEQCESRLTECLTEENAAELALLGFQHSCPRLQDAAVYLIARDPPRVWRTDSWAEGVAHCPQLMRQVSQLVTAKISTVKIHRQQLHEAAECGKVAKLQELLAKGADVDACCEVGFTALHRAARAGHAGAVSYLLGAGANVDAKNDWWQTPLHLAAAFGNVAAASWLLTHAASVDATDVWGQTALQIAAHCGEVAVVEVLLQAGADPSAGCGRTPLELALEYNRTIVVDVLRAAQSPPVT